MCIHKNTPIWTDNCVLQLCVLNLKQPPDIKAFSNISVGCIGGFTKKNLPHKLFLILTLSNYRLILFLTLTV